MAMYVSFREPNYPHKGKSACQTPMRSSQRVESVFYLPGPQIITRTTKIPRNRVTPDNAKLDSPVPGTLTYRIFALGSNSINQRLNLAIKRRRLSQFQ